MPLQHFILKLDQCLLPILVIINFKVADGQTRAQKDLKQLLDEVVYLDSGVRFVLFEGFAEEGIILGAQDVLNFVRKSLLDHDDFLFFCEEFV